MATPQDPPPAGPEESTVGLPHPDAVGTVRLTPPGLAATLHLTEPGTPGSGEAHRFGSGVPTLTDTTDDRVASVWHGTVSPSPDGDTGNAAHGRRPRGRVLGGWLLPAVVLIAVLACLAWQRHAPALAVTGATVHTGSAGPACDGTATITGTLHTNGLAGTVNYRWKRSDGTASGTLQQRVARGTHRTDVVLRWTFDGHGTLRATATLEVLSPDPTTASVTFRYACP